MGSRSSILNAFFPSGTCRMLIPSFKPRPFYFRIEKTLCFTVTEHFLQVYVAIIVNSNMKMWILLKHHAFFVESLQFIKPTNTHIISHKTLLKNTLKHCDTFRSFQIINWELCSLLKIMLFSRRPGWTPIAALDTANCREKNRIICLESIQDLPVFHTSVIFRVWLFQSGQRFCLDLSELLAWKYVSFHSYIHTYNYI